MTAPSDRSSIGARLARVGDVEQMLAFMRRFYEFFEYPFDEAVARDTLMPLLEPDSAFGRVWILRADDEDVGYVVAAFGYSLEHRGRDAFVDEIWVEPPWRGRGFGEAALRLAERECAAAGVRALHLEIEQTNERAKALYQRIGFAGHGRTIMTKRID